MVQNVEVKRSRDALHVGMLASMQLCEGITHVLPGGGAGIASVNRRHHRLVHALSGLLLYRSRISNQRQRIIDGGLGVHRLTAEPFAVSLAEAHTGGEARSQTLIFMRQFGGQRGRHHHVGAVHHLRLRIVDHPVEHYAVILRPRSKEQRGLHGLCAAVVYLLPLPDERFQLVLRLVDAHHVGLHAQFCHRISEPVAERLPIDIAARDEADVLHAVQQDAAYHKVTQRHVALRKEEYVGLGRVDALQFGRCGHGQQQRLLLRVEGRGGHLGVDGGLRANHGDDLRVVGDGLIVLLRHHVLVVPHQFQLHGVARARLSCGDGLERPVSRALKLRLLRLRHRHRHLIFLGMCAN